MVTILSRSEWDNALYHIDTSVRARSLWVPIGAHNTLSHYGNHGTISLSGCRDFHEVRSSNSKDSCILQSQMLHRDSVTMGT